MRKLITLGLVLVASIAMMGCQSMGKTQDTDMAFFITQGVLVSAIVGNMVYEGTPKESWSIPMRTTAYQRATR